MGSVSRVWMAASVAVVGAGHADQGGKWTSLRLAKERLVAAAGFFPAMWFSTSLAAAGSGGGRKEGRILADDSLRKAMYLSCWGPS
ncbi:hypothetical protein AXF42_Ash016266 [Apostasia shenzhenica]|uniref:Uncharacterized protein n=1 Tax=Apostasia shenzhenica TaxID=1088818 RepID=A0A2H9ZX82_9ASPA|nr:hypothetical protein AXF42_Ash016266 [Apostasia shenzhenica]